MSKISIPSVPGDDQLSKHHSEWRQRSWESFVNPKRVCSQSLSHKQRTHIFTFTHLELCWISELGTHDSWVICSIIEEGFESLYHHNCNKLTNCRSLQGDIFSGPGAKEDLIHPNSISNDAGLKLTVHDECDTSHVWSLRAACSWLGQSSEKPQMGRGRFWLSLCPPRNVHFDNPSEWWSGQEISE